MISWLTRETVEALAGGVLVTVLLTLLTSALSLIAGIAACAGRLSTTRFTNRIASIYVEVFRNVPALIQIIFWVFAVPNMFPAGLRQRLFFDNAAVEVLRSITGLSIPYFAVGACLGLVLNTSAHLGEILRAGVGTLPAEHLEAARSLGARPRVAFLTLLLPGGIRAAFPAITTRLIHNMKNTALVSFVAVPDLFQETQAQINRTFRATEFLLLAAVLYLALAGIMTLLLDRVDRRLNRVSRG